MNHVLIMIAILLFVSCEKADTTTQRPKHNAERPPAHISYNFHVVFTDSSHTRAVLSAAQAWVYEDRQQTVLRDTLTVEFYSRSTGNRVARLSADSAVIDDRTQNMTAYGDVRIWSDSSQTSLTTSVLRWNQQQQRIQTDAYVSIVGPDESIQGTGFESDQFLTSYKMYRVHGEHR
jgi:LPS export ABC transporter protein LptC